MPTFAGLLGIIKNTIMNLKSVIPASFLFLAVLLISSCGGKSDADMIKSTFDYYQNAVVDNNGKAAADCLDSKTLEWYSKILEMTKESNKSSLEKINFLSKKSVLAIRQEFNKKQINDLNPKTAFAFAVEKSLYDQDFLKGAGFNNLKIENDKAIVALAKDGKGIKDNFLTFKKEGGKWKINFAALINAQDDDATGILVENIPSENAHALKAIKELSDKPIKSYIWKPVNRWR